MPTTTTKTTTLADELNSGNPNTVADVLRKMLAGTMASKIKVTVAALTATATPDITSAAVKAAGTISGITLATGQTLPPIGQVVSLRISASATATSLGTYGVTDTGGTAIIPPGGASASMGIAKLSDDGTVITFPNTVTGFVLEYYPAPFTAMTSAWSTGV